MTLMIDTLKKKLALYTGGVTQLQQRVSALENELAARKSELLATSGAKLAIENLIKEQTEAEVAKPEAISAAVGEPTPAPAA